jgi:cytochrome d ubiquinol oxidase subunit II
VRPLAVLAVAAVVWGWGVAQQPDVLPGALSIEQAAAPSATLVALFVIFGAAAIVVVPAFVLLLRLQQRRALEHGEDSPGAAT